MPYNSRHSPARVNQRVLVARGGETLPCEVRRGRSRPRSKPSLEMVRAERIEHARGRVIGALQRRFKRSVEIFGGKPTVDKLVKTVIRWVNNDDRKLGHNLREKTAAVRAAIVRMLSNNELELVLGERVKYVLVV